MRVRGKGVVRMRAEGEGGEGEVRMGWYWCPKHCCVLTCHKTTTVVVAKTFVVTL